MVPWIAIQFKTVLTTNMVANVTGLFIELKEAKAWCISKSQCVAINIRGS